MHFDYAFFIIYSLSTFFNETFRFCLRNKFFNLHNFYLRAIYNKFHSKKSSKLCERKEIEANHVSFKVSPVVQRMSFQENLSNSILFV